MLKKLHSLAVASTSALADVGGSAVDAAKSCMESTSVSVEGLTRTTVGLGLSGLETMDRAKNAAADTIADNLWAVRKPLEKTGMIAAGTVRIIAPMAVERALDKLAERLLGSVWVGPLAPIGLMLGVIEAYQDIVKAKAEFERLVAETDGHVAAQETERLEARRKRAEERLERWRALQGNSVMAAGNNQLAALIDASANNARYEVTVLEGAHAGKLLSELTSVEIAELKEQASDPDTIRLLSAWMQHIDQ